LRSIIRSKKEEWDMTNEQKLKEMVRAWCKWNRREMTEKEFIYKFEEIYKKETHEAWNDPLEKLLV